MKHICDQEWSSDLIIRGLEAFPGRRGGAGGAQRGSTALLLHSPPHPGAACLAGLGSGLLLLEKHRFAFNEAL